MIDLRLGDCLDVMRGIPDASIDAVITDPPYPREFDHVWDTLGNETPRIMKDGSFLATLCGHYQLPRVIDAMRKGGLEWYWMAIIPNNNQPIMHGFKVKVTYKPFLVFRKGKCQPNRIWYDNFGLRLKTKDWAESQKLHKWGQNESALYEPIDALSKEGDTILDPFAGSGTTLIAALKLGRNAIGIEISPEYYAIAERRIQEAQAQMAMPMVTA